MLKATLRTKLCIMGGFFITGFYLVIKATKSLGNVDVSFPVILYFIGVILITTSVLWWGHINYFEGKKNGKADAEHDFNGLMEMVEKSGTIIKVDNNNPDQK